MHSNGFKMVKDIPMHVNKDIETSYGLCLVDTTPSSIQFQSNYCIQVISRP